MNLAWSGELASSIRATDHLLCIYLSTGSFLETNALKLVSLNLHCAQCAETLDTIIERDVVKRGVQLPIQSYSLLDARGSRYNWGAVDPHHRITRRNIGPYPRFSYSLRECNRPTVKREKHSRIAEGYISLSAPTSHLGRHYHLVLDHIPTIRQAVAEEESTRLCACACTWPSSSRVAQTSRIQSY